MYAKANPIQITTSEITTTRSRQPRRHFAVRAQFHRFLNWFGSGGVDTHSLKAGHGHGSEFMLINGQIVATPSCREETGADKFTM